MGQEKTIIVGGDYNYPPYSFINENGVEVGYDVDVIKAIMQEIGFEVEFRFDHWDTILYRLANGEIDVIASIVYSESRENQYDFTFPLHTEYYSIFAKKETKINDIFDLESKRPAYFKGDISNEIFLKPIGLLSDSVPVKSLPEAFGLIKSGKCDYVVAPYPLGMKIIKEKGFKNIEAKKPQIIPSVYCLAVNEGNFRLLAQLNTGIGRLSRSGELERIYNKWVKYQRKDDQYKNRYKYSIIVLVVISAISLLLLIFWYSLKKTVTKKTLQIKDAEEIYQKVFNSVDDVLLVFNRSGIIVDANHKVLQLYNLSYDEIIGKRYVDIISDNNKELFQGIVDSYVSETINFSGEVKSFDGERTRWFKVRAVRLKLDREERYMAVFQDITDVKLSIINLEEAKELADEANKAKNTFLATISHEIRTPLNAIIGYTNLLQKTKLDKKQQDYNQKINVSGELLLNLVNDILDLTKMDAKKLILNNEPFNLSEVINLVCEVIRFKAKEKGLNFTIEIEEGLPKTLNGDELRLSQILLNILSNAIKFTHQGDISIKVFQENLANRDEVIILFSIKDTGIGISFENQEKLFKPFEQAQNSNKKKYGGTGLGLAITKQLVDLLGGEIVFVSSVGAGSIFNISIPFKVFCGKEIDKAKVDDSNGESNCLQGISVLMVEDNEFNAEILMTQLLERNLKVTHAASGAKAIELLSKQSFHVILMDIEMPDMDGFETTQKIRTLNIAQIPIIALSAHSLDPDREKAFELGMDMYLSKPVKIEKLLSTIHESVHNHLIIAKQSFDINKGIAFFENDEEMFKRAAKRFHDNYKDIPNNLLAYNKTNIEELKSIAHNLKSAAKMIGAPYLSEMSKELEEHIRSCKEHIDLKDVKNLKDELKKVLMSINAYV
jgi:PAS domain S-box-containing protein